MKAAIVETADVWTGDAEINAANFHIGHLLGLDDRIADVFLGEIEVDNFPLAHAAGFRLAEADDAERAGFVDFADDGAYFGSADIQPDNG
jgi:hypothetical protein